jgi:lactoylglutathione lyase
MQGVTAFGHVAIKVSDLDRSLDYYCNKLQFPEFLRLTRADGTPWIVYVRINDLQYLEIFPGAATDTAPDNNANGTNHVCWTVDDLDGTVARIKARGVTMLSEPREKPGADNNRGAYIQDPDGNRIELMEMQPHCVQYEAIREFHKTGKATSLARG